FHFRFHPHHWPCSRVCVVVPVSGCSALNRLQGQSSAGVRSQFDLQLKYDLKCAAKSRLYLMPFFCFLARFGSGTIQCDPESSTDYPASSIQYLASTIQHLPSAIRSAVSINCLATITGTLLQLENIRHR